MKFKFSFATVLKHRRNLEKMAQKDYAQAQAEVDECMAQINHLYGMVDYSREQIAEAQSKGGKASSKLKMFEDAIDGLNVKIEMKRFEARELMQVAEEKREILLEAAKDFKSMDLLKEKRLKEFKLEQKKKEAKEVDDLVSMRFVREK